MTFTPEETRAMVFYALNPGHSDLDDEQPVALDLGQGRWLRCPLGAVRRAQREAMALGHAVREAARTLGALKLAYDHQGDPAAFGRLLVEAQQHNANLGSALTRIAFDASSLKEA